MSNDSRVRFSDLCGFTPKQWDAIAALDSHRYTLFGGARGPGKSYWLRYSLLRLLLQWGGSGHTGVRVMLACEDYPSLYERQISKIDEQFPAWIGSIHKSRNEFRLLDNLGGGVIAMRNLDDPSKYQSAEYAAIGVDELTKNSERTFHVLRGSLRWPGIDDTRFLAASNPDAGWVRSYWLEHRFPPEMEAEADQFAFVPALAGDNPHLPESYTDMLDTLPGALRAAWRYGDWYAGTEGLVFGDFTADNITDEDADTTRPFELAIDDGYIDPRATLFIQKNHRGDIFVFDELYQTKTLEEDTISAIKNKCAEHGLGLPSRAAVSHEAVALRRRVTEAGIPAQNWMSDRAGGGRSTRLQAIKLTRSLICDGQGYRALKVHRRCTNLLDEIMSGYKYPDGVRGTDEVPVDGNDHACEALSSWIWLNAVSTPAKRHPHPLL